MRIHERCKALSLCSVDNARYFVPAAKREQCNCRQTVNPCMTDSTAIMSVRVPLRYVLNADHTVNQTAVVRRDAFGMTSPWRALGTMMYDKVFDRANAVVSRTVPNRAQLVYWNTVLYEDDRSNADARVTTETSVYRIRCASVEPIVVSTDRRALVKTRTLQLWRYNALHGSQCSVLNGVKSAKRNNTVKAYSVQPYVVDFTNDTAENAPVNLALTPSVLARSYKSAVCTKMFTAQRVAFKPISVPVYDMITRAQRASCFVTESAETMVGLHILHWQTTNTDTTRTACVVHIESGARCGRRLTLTLVIGSAMATISKSHVLLRSSCKLSKIIYERQQVTCSMMTRSIVTSTKSPALSTAIRL